MSHRRRRRPADHLLLAVAGEGPVGRRRSTTRRRTRSRGGSCWRRSTTSAAGRRTPPGQATTQPVRGMRGATRPIMTAVRSGLIAAGLAVRGCGAANRRRSSRGRSDRAHLLGDRPSVHPRRGAEHGRARRLGPELPRGRGDGERGRRRGREGGRSRRRLQPSDPSLQEDEDARDRRLQRVRPCDGSEVEEARRGPAHVPRTVSRTSRTTCLSTRRRSSSAADATSRHCSRRHLRTWIPRRSAGSRGGSCASTS